VGRDSSVSIVTRSRDLIPVGARISALFQSDPGALPVSYTMGAGSFLGVKQQERDVDRLPPSKTEVKEIVELNLYLRGVITMCYRY